MSQYLHFTEEPYEALQIRGYSFSTAPYGFNFGPTEKVMSYKIGNFGALFLNNLMERSGLGEAASFRYFFGAKRYDVGDLAQCSQIVLDDIYEKGKSFEEADAKVIELFLSDDLSSQGMRLPHLYEVPMVNPDSVVKRYDEDGRLVLRVKGDDKPFYYLINMASVQVAEAGLPALFDDWKEMLVRWQYSYCHDAEGDRLAVSNTKSAYFGLPPNSRALRMPLIKTRIMPEKCQTVGKKMSVKVKPQKIKQTLQKKSTQAKRVIEPNAWKPLLASFLETGSQAAYERLVGCDSAWKAFYSPVPPAGETLEVMSKYASKRLRKPLLGVSNAVDGVTFVKMLTGQFEGAFSKLVIILKWNTLTRWEQGKVFFKEEAKQVAAEQD